MMQRICNVRFRKHSNAVKVHWRGATHNPPIWIFSIRRLDTQHNIFAPEQTISLNKLYAPNLGMSLQLDIFLRVLLNLVKI